MQGQPGRFPARNGFTPKKRISETSSTSSWFTRTPLKGQADTCDNLSIQRSSSLLTPPLTGISATKSAGLSGGLQETGAEVNQQREDRVIPARGKTGKKRPRPKQMNTKGEDLWSLAKRRKIEILDGSQQRESKRCEKSLPVRDLSNAGNTGNDNFSLQLTRGTFCNEGRAQHILSKDFSTGNSLKTFLGLRGDKTISLGRKIEDSDIVPPQHSSAGMSALKNPNPSLEQRSHDQSQPQPFASPPIPANIPPFNVIISSELIKQRSLFRAIEKLCTHANFIERDFSAPAQQHSTDYSRNVASSGTEAEADLIISPGCGIICTTLQKIRQRALPGKALRVGPKERIDWTVPRYERLIVLVYEGGISPPAEGKSAVEIASLGDKDCEVFAELVGHCAKHPPERVQIIFVAGGESELAKWVVGLMIQYGASVKETKLLQEETLWELFLRKAGLNAYAAQVVLSELKAPNGKQGQEVRGYGLKQEHGLAAFVKMSLCERLERFEALFGGRKVLLRVSAALDAKWR